MRTGDGDDRWEGIAGALHGARILRSILFLCCVLCSKAEGLLDLASLMLLISA